MKKKYNFILSFILIIFTFSACINDLDVTPINPQKVQTFDQDKVFAKIYALWPLTGQNGPNGNSDIYAPDEGRFCLYRLLWNCNEITTDEAICAWSDEETIDLNTNKWTTLNSTIKATYDRLYLVIVNCNHFLENTEGKADDHTVKQRAEVRFLRALAYYYLLDMFGNVPFTTQVGEIPDQIERKDLFIWVEDELKSIEKDMYEPQTQPYYRVDKVANWLLQARLYLNAEIYTSIAKWDSAAYYAKKVIDSPYELTGTYRHLFMADNAGALDGSTVNTAPTEIIFPLAADGRKTQSWGHSQFLICSTYTSGMGNWGTEGWGGNRARPELVKKFFPNPGAIIVKDNTNLTTITYPSNLKDDRALFYKEGRTLGIEEITDFKKGYSVIKFTNIRADGGQTQDITYVDMDVPFMRKAEAYLTYAEAVLRGAPLIDGYSAVDAVNALRTRAHSGKIATQITLTDAEDFTASKFNIINEWAREFFFEGRRRSDLIRFGMFGGETAYQWQWKHGVQNGENFPVHYNLFPIPAADLNANSKLQQNEGY